MSEIIYYRVLPNLKLSLEVSSGLPGGVTGYRISLDDGDAAPVTVDVPVAAASFEALRGSHYLPNCVALGAGKTYAVTVQPMDGLALVGTESDPIAVTGNNDAQWEITLRQIITDRLAAAGITHTDQEVTVNRDRMGRPQTATNQLGRAGIYVVVDVPYMSSEDPFYETGTAQLDVTVPIRVIAKAGHPDGAEPATIVAAKVRRAINQYADAFGYGVTTWRWSGDVPDDSGDKIITVRMQALFSMIHLLEDCSG